MPDKLSKWIKSLLGDKHELTDSIREALEDRLTSPFYGYFIISWILVNWDYLYSALFVGGQEILMSKNLLRNEYLLQEILPHHYVSFLYWWNFLILPFILTIIVFWIMPFVTREFYKKHIKNKIILEAIRLKETAEKSQAEAQAVEAETKVIEAEVQQAEIRKKAEITSPEILWRNEYEDFKNHKLYKKFQSVIDSIYKHSGDTYLYDNFSNEIIFELDKNILVYGDVNGLLSIDNKADKINLTEKGKEFVKWYSNDS